MKRSFLLSLLSVLVTFTVCVTAADTSDSRENEIWSGEMCRRNENIEAGDGFLTKRGEFPWSVAIFQLTDVGGIQMNVFICGGILVSRGKVLTVAECVHQVRTADLRVHIGVWHLEDRNKSSGEVLGVEKTEKHEGYSTLSKRHNLALLTLDDNVTFDESVNSICLADPEQQYESNHHCYTVGWGTSFINGTNQLLRLKTSLMTDRTDCQERLQQYRRYLKYKLLPEALCTLAGEDTIDDDYPCSRIIGSVLVCTKGTRRDPYYLVGVGSQLPQNYSLSDKYPAVFMDLRKYASWINPLIEE